MFVILFRQSARASLLLSSNILRRLHPTTPTREPLLVFARPCSRSVGS